MSRDTVDGLHDPPRYCASVRLARSVLMVRPAAFGFNPEAAATNRFAAAPAEAEVAERARAEVEAFAEALDRAGVNVVLAEDTPDPPKPDAAFPNNWVSFHEDGTVVLYPMQPASRRPERRLDLVDALARDHGFRVARVVDLSGEEDRGAFLEGTGSVVLDRVAGRAWACPSPRTDLGLLARLGDLLGYAPATFRAEVAGVAPYHTNVILSAGETFAALVTDAVLPEDRARVREGLMDGGRELVELDLGEGLAFAGNLLQLQGDGPVVAISAGAWAALSPGRRAALERHGTIVAPRLDVVERVGGGSARCCLAEVFLPRA